MEQSFIDKEEETALKLFVQSHKSKDVLLESKHHCSLSILRVFSGLPGVQDCV